MNPDETMTGGLPPPSLTGVVGEGPVIGPSVPGGGPVITVRTDQEAMMLDGLMGSMSGRQIRRSPYGGFGRGGGMGSMMPMSPMTSRYTPMEGGAMPSSNNTPIRITKLE